MKKALIVAAVLVGLAVLYGCGPRESALRINALTKEDCRALQAKAAKLCDAYVSVDNHDPERDQAYRRTWLSGDGIPAEFASLKPTRVLIDKTYAIIELWHTPAGDDTIYIERADSEIWTVKIHEGSWMNKERLIWTSRSKK